MIANPNENPIQTASILGDHFRRKGYLIAEVKEADATILILMHEKYASRTLPSSSLMHEPHKKYLRPN